MSEFDTEFQNQKREIVLPNTEVNPIVVERDVQYYYREKAPARPGEKEKTRWEHIRDHKIDLMHSFKTKDNQEIINKLADIAGKEDKKILEFYEGNRLVKYDTETQVVVVLGGIGNINEPPPKGKILTAYKADPEKIMNRVTPKAGEEGRGARWQPHNQKFGQQYAGV